VEVCTTCTILKEHMMEKTYERIAIKLLRGQPKPKPFVKVMYGVLVVGTKSLHRTPQSRRWRMFWRLKSQRQTQVATYWKTK
jgi:hypothetical protein